MENIDALMDVLELSAAAQSAIRLPLNLSEAEKVSGNKWKKEILRIGELIVDSTGRKFNFTSDFLKSMKENYHKGILDYVPLVYADSKTNAHTFSAKAEDYAGLVEGLELDDPDNPTKAYAIFNLTEDTSKMVEHNRKFGVSVTAHPNFVDGPRGEYVGPMLLDVCATHKPKLTKMEGWDRVEVMASNVHEKYGVIDLSDETYNVIETTDRGGGNMAEQDNNNSKPLELSQEMLTQIMESDAVKTAITNQVTAATAEKDAEITRLSNQVGDIQDKSYSQVVKAATASYKQAGVPPVIVDAAEALMLSLSADETDETIQLSVKEGDETKTLELSRVELITKMLDETKGFVDLSAETGSTEDVDDSGRMTGDRRKNAVNHLLSLAGSQDAE